MARDKWWWRQGRARGRYAPRLWSVWLVALIWVTAALAVALAIYLQLQAVPVPRPGPNGGSASRDPLDVIKTTITVTGFVGAVLVGLYAYRKQRLVEGDAQRADAEQLAQRYTTAADQLGHEKAAVRLAGVYAMALLADDWAEQRQACIGVLCAYLRMPYDPDTDSPKREGEREVRLTIIRIIQNHLQKPDDPTAWCGLELDFTNATFDGGDFSGAKFTKAKSANPVSVYFIGAKFTGGNVFFCGVEFAGTTVSFSSAKFTGGRVSFEDARFTDGDVYFRNAEFAGAAVSFPGAKFTGGTVSFDGAKYTGGDVSFNGAEITGSSITWGPFEPPAAWTALQGGER